MSTKKSTQQLLSTLFVTTHAPKYTESDKIRVYEAMKRSGKQPAIVVLQVQN